jgi:hypothetical protein
LHAPNVSRDSKHMCSSPSERGRVGVTSEKVNDRRGEVGSAACGARHEVATTTRAPRRRNSKDLMVLILNCCLIDPWA